MDHLLNYMNSNISHKVNIKDEIEHWKRTNQIQEPEILIDLEQFQYVFAQRDQIGVLLGGRYQIYNHLFERFVKHLLTNKVRLKFFVAARQATDDLNLFIPKMENDYYKHIQLMDKLLSNNQVVNDKRNFTVPATIEYNLLYLVKKFCSKESLYISYYRHTQEIAKYANIHSNKVLAIISNDLQLLLFDGDFKFWYANDIDFRALNISQFCRKSLETAIGLNANGLQLLGVLISSPYLPSETMEQFFSKFDILPLDNNNLARYIKWKSSESGFDLDKICSEIFSVNETSNGGRNSIENGLNCFNIQFSVDTPVDDAFSKFSKERNSFIYQLITNDIYLVKDISFIDYRNDRATEFMSILVPLIQKINGILFSKNIIKPMDRKICIKLAHDEPYRVVEIPIIYPNLSMPQLFDLIYKNRDFQYDNRRWSLLAWIFEFDDTFFGKLKCLRNKSIVVALTLRYLLQNNVIKTLEADAILYSEYEAQARKENEMPPKIPYPKCSIHNDCIQIAHLYTKMFVMINRCLEVCGLNRQKVLIQFDGPLFYLTLEKFTNLKSVQLNETLSKIEHLRIYL